MAREFNAHGFGVGIFYLKAPKGAIPTGFRNDDVLGLATVWDDVKGSNEALTVTTSGGADCVLHDFRLLISSQHKPSLLVLADREMGETFVDEERVTFKTYTLTQNIEKMFGPQLSTSTSQTGAWQNASTATLKRHSRTSSASVITGAD